MRGEKRKGESALESERQSKREFTGGFRIIALYSLSGVLFGLSFPNEFFPQGLGVLGFIALLPALFAVRSGKPNGAFMGGFAFGLIAYSFDSWWLLNTRLPAFLFVVIGSGVEYSLLFGLLHYVHNRLGRISWLVGLFVWIAFEYAKTLGVLGYPFGILGYSQYRNLPLIQIASVTGVWGVSAIVALPQFILAGLPFRLRFHMPTSQDIRPLLKALTAILVPLAFVLGFGYWRLGLPQDTGKSIKVALIQPNRPDATQASLDFEDNFEELRTLTDEALSQNPDLVVWPETAIIPSIYYHLKYRTNAELDGLVKNIDSYLKSLKTPIILGNNYNLMEKGKDGIERRVNYNAALALTPGIGDYQVYKKNHLVPFAEFDPLAGRIQPLTSYLVQWRGPLWTPGVEIGPLSVGDLKVATPICFEDAFGDLVRRLLGKDGMAIVSLVDDAWSSSLAEENEHFACSVLRAVENGVPAIRGTNSGISAITGTLGELVAKLGPIEQGFLLGEVSFSGNRMTLYRAYGDWFAILCMVILLLSLLGIMPEKARWTSALRHDHVRQERKQNLRMVRSEVEIQGSIDNGIRIQQKD